MTHHLFKTLLLILLVICPTIMADTLSAWVDRTEVATEETFNLTIETDSTDNPNLEPLRQFFDIQSVQESSQVTFENGEASSSNLWIITLHPKQKSNGIVIPALTVGSQQTKPITIKVIETPKVITSADGKEQLKLEISIDKPTAYIQQQIILTLHVYASTNVKNVGKLVIPALPDFIIKQLNDVEYSKEINGVMYSIVERRYAISPQKSGELKIPPFALSALINENQRTQSRTIVSNELLLQVKPKPANYPANTPWLPAQKVTLSEQWDKNLDKVFQGDSLVRTLKINAVGLTTSQITSINTPNIKGMRSYPDRPLLQDSISQNTFIGVREEHEVLVPVQTGEIIIPEIKLPWWNVDTDKLEYATVPERKIMVEPNPVFNANNQATPTTNIEPTIIKKIESPTLWIWQLLTAIFAMTTIIGFALWIYARKQPAIIKEPAPVINPRTLLDDIKRACQAKDPQASRQALDNWVKQQPENLTEVAVRYPALAEALHELNEALYSENGQEWQGDKLWEAVQSLPKKMEDEPLASSILPPLYPK